MEMSHDIVARFNFAKTFFWEQVLWSDKRKVEFFFRHKDVQKIWQKKGEAFLSKNTVSTLKLEGSSMFWGSFSSRGTGWLIAMRGIMKFEDYIRILMENTQLSV